jgi:GTP cyclohydrolase IA
MDAEGIRSAVRDLLKSLGEDPYRPGLTETPGRVADAYSELFEGYAIDPVSLLAPLPDERAQGLIMVRGVDLVSFCEHHLLPFMGQATVAYLPGPDGRICGLSKLSRLMEALSRRLQVQERLVAQAADALEEALAPAGVFVMVEAEHLCMTIRGARKPGAKMVTIEARGALASAEEKANLIALAKDPEA